MLPHQLESMDLHEPSLAGPALGGYSISRKLLRANLLTFVCPFVFFVFEYLEPRLVLAHKIYETSLAIRGVFVEATLDVFGQSVARTRYR